MVTTVQEDGACGEYWLRRWNGWCVLVEKVEWVVSTG